MDAIDIAAEKTQQWLDRQLAERRQRHKAKYGSTPASSKPLVVECTDCGDKIESRRLIAIPGTTICFDCASAAEKEMIRQQRLAGNVAIRY
jgi:phage/conjugal plasmid C-4 type zinc finger TraR family protein